MKILEIIRIFSVKTCTIRTFWVCWILRILVNKSVQKYLSDENSPKEEVCAETKFDYTEQVLFLCFHRAKNNL